MFVKINRKSRINVDELCEYSIYYSESYKKWYLQMSFRNNDSYISKYVCDDEHEAYELLEMLDRAVGISSNTIRD